MSERLAALIRADRPIVVLTGAGVSQESGIPTFRGPDPTPAEAAREEASGTASEARRDGCGRPTWRRFDPLEYASLGAFRRDPAKVWRFYAHRFSTLIEAEPNRAHEALAELERLGLVKAIVTQNVDLLHERAGSRSVVSVHGSIRTSSCPRCGEVYELRAVLVLLDEGEGMPRCRRCGAVLKPGVVLFDEFLPEEAIERAFALAREARLLLVVGSSLEVYPVAGLPHETLRAGGRVAVVNEGPTTIDGRAVLKVEGKAGDVLAATLAELTPRLPVHVLSYDPGWPEAYEEEAARIRAVLGRLVVEIEHIGSTAVPGLAAKPIIDISVGLTTLELPPGRIAAMERLGYEYLGEYGLPGRLFFRKGRRERTHHVHAVEHGGGRWHTHRALRDFLRAHPEEAERYGEHKRRVAEQVGDSQEYWHAKQPFVRELVARASRWYAERG
ncbi:MAG: NAD-dependent protein deacylase [Actinomycetota bacterium]|nr:NAD-dependent protein deacylase [Actinomycetota bacterium]